MTFCKNPDLSRTDRHKKPLILKRQWIIFFCCTACYLMYVLRYNISVAIISIVDEKELVSVEDYDLINSIDNQSLIVNNETSRVLIFKKKYLLDDLMVGQILASYFYGYTIFQLPAGRLSELFGAKWLLGFGTLLSGILSFLTPLVLDFSPTALIIIRIIIGSLHASILACSYTLFAEWLPDKKKCNAITLVNVFFELGGVCTYYLTGYICSIESLGWRYSFYIFSSFCFIWFIPYCFLVYSKPEDDLFLSDYEKKLIENDRTIEYANQDFKNKTMIKIPPKLDYKIILTSKPVIASCVAKIAISLGYYIVTIKMPAYLHDIFNVSVKSNGIFTALSMVGILTSKILCFISSSYLINLKLMSLTNLRKTFQTIAMLVPSISLFIITLKNDNQTLDIGLIVLFMFGIGFVCLGDTPLPSEFAKDLSGSIFGLTNTFSCMSGIISPLMVSFFMDSFDDKAYAWNLIFYITIIFLLIGAVIFVFLASSELQSWAECKFISIDELKQYKESIESPS